MKVSLEKRSRRAHLSIAVTSCLAFGTASGLTVMLPGSASARPAHDARTEPSPEPSHDPEAHHLKIDIAPTGDPTGPWRLRVENTGTAPVRLVADARLVSLDVEASASAEAKAEEADDDAPKHRDKRKGGRVHERGAAVAHCRLPAEMRPADDDEARALVLPPGRAYAETFDVRALCFGEELDALVAGAKVTAHLGWPEKRTSRAKRVRRAESASDASGGPFVIGPVDLAGPTSTGGVAFVSELDLPAQTLGPKARNAVPDAAGSDELANAPMTADTGADGRPMVAPDADGDGFPDDPTGNETGGDRHPHLALTLPRYVDRESRSDVPASLTVRNDGLHPRTLLYRASRVKFDVVAPGGERSSCGAPPEESPPRDFFLRLHHDQSAHLALLVSDVCDVDTFARAGVYEVVAHLDDSGLSGARQGLNAFSGVLTSKTMLVRIRRSARPESVPRPRLE